jgi:hypothetical protein
MRDEFIKLIEKLEAAIGHESSKDEFQQILLTAMRLLDLNDEAVAVRFRASRPTITRWRNGSNAPHAALRPAVYEWLLAQTKGRLQRFDSLSETTVPKTKAAGRGGSPSYPHSAVAAKGAR